MNTVDQYIDKNLARTKGRRAKYGCNKDIYCEVKPKSTASQTPLEDKNDVEFMSVKPDIWFNIAMQINPEDVLNFALICRETAYIVNSQSFWRNMYMRYCRGQQPATGRNKIQATELQWKRAKNCDMRSLVVKALYTCYQPLKSKLENGYSLDWLLQRTFVSCWQKNYKERWVMCYKFWNRQTPKCNNAESAEQMQEMEVASDWETLVDADTPCYQNHVNSYEGVVILVMVYRHFVPMPMQLLLSQGQLRYRLKATREMLCRNMRAKNLELDFAKGTSSDIAYTVEYPEINLYRVLPWWHPEFKKFIEYE